MWDKGQFAKDDKFIISYRYNGVIRTANVEEVRLSFGVLYRLGNKTHSWNLEKKENIGWIVTSPHQMKPDLLKAIGDGIDVYLSSQP